MNKKTIYILVAVALVAIAWTMVAKGRNAAVDNGDGDLGPATQTNFAGTVTAIDLEQAMVDGPYVVEARAEDGTEALIAVPSMGIMLCAANASITHPSELAVGDRIEVNGTLTADGSIVPCESPDHYLRKLSEDRP